MKKILIFVLAVFAMTLTSLAKTYTVDLIPPETVEYTLDEYEDSLKCTLFIEEDGLFGLKVIQLASSEYEPKIKVTLSKKGKELSGFTTEKSGFYYYDFYMLEGLEEGEYDLKIENAAKFTDTSFVIETSFTPWKSIEKQDNKSFEKATKMELGERYKGGIMLADEADYFSFEMPNDGYAVIDLYSPNLKYFSLYDNEYNLVGTMNVAIDEADTVFETRCGLAKGTYYISVTPELDFQDPNYALEVKPYYDAVFEKEYNNTYPTATLLPVTGKGGEMRGNLFGADDVDVYSFTLDGDGYVTAKITDLYLTRYGHYDFSILEADGTPIVTRTNCNTYAFENVKLEKGNYYLAVSCSDERNFTSFGYKVSVDAVIIDEETEQIKPEIEQFSDISSDDWYATDVLKARQMGLIDGMGGNRFVPMGNVTIAEAVTMAARMYERHFGREITPVSDDGAKWYWKYVMYTIATEIISPDDFDNYDAVATRAQMAYIFAGVLKNAELPGILAYEADIPDVDENHKYVDEIQLLYKLNILNGVDEKGTFLPENNITRAESAVIMLRCAELLGIN